ncbi:hypothetical protein B0O99DRAFT_506527 [Bisporella sp. PMI_857]|nr:hypothetical protein B0O99DRAFT_506527 [Bisporella sp. PMI_857]
MVNLVSKLAIVAVVLLAILYQLIFKTVLFDTLGVGRSVLSIRHFDNVRCEKIIEPGLEACEDMWLHQPTGNLYLACSNSQSTTQWLPAIGKLNASGRSLVDRMAVLDTRGPGPLSSRLKWLKADQFSGTNGDGTFNVQGFDIRAHRHSDVLRILLVNNRPPIDPNTGVVLDASKVGANSTIEQFQTTVGSEIMHHVRTYSNEVIATPNRVQWVTDHSFVFTNSYNVKTGSGRILEVLFGGGNIGYCDRNRCNIAMAFGRDFRLPNGLLHTPDGLIYVPSNFNGEIRVFKLSDHQPPRLDKVDSIKLPLPIDNLSIDANGDIFAATFPRLFSFLEGFKDPLNSRLASTIYKISRKGKRGVRARRSDWSIADGYNITKVLEDDGTLLPGSTTAIHDVETGRIFLSGVVSPYITICEMR